MELTIFDVATFPIFSNHLPDMEKTWPTLRLSFSSPPSLEAWESFFALATADLDLLGIEEGEIPQDTGGPASAPSSVRFFFPAEAVEDALKADSREKEIRGLADRFFPGSLYELGWTNLPDEDWGASWRRHFHTMRVGQRLLVGPPWEEKLGQEGLKDPVRLLIDPGQAFGTGSHETTRLCLEMIEELPPDGGALLDIGTGSGILSIGWIKLGGSFATGLEIDPVCEENFYLNARLNGVEDAVRFIHAAEPLRGLEQALSAGCPAPGYIACNMLSERFSPHLAALREIGKPMILSGFLLNERPAVSASLKECGWSMIRRLELSEWGAFLCHPV